MIKQFVQDFLTFFVVVDPVGVLPLYIGLTMRKSEAARREIAFRAVSIASIVLLSFAILGQVLLEGLGVRLNSFKIAGGIILFLFGLKMIFNSEIAEKEVLSPEAGHDVAVFPLALPSLAGPGAMLAVVVNMAASGADWGARALKIVPLLLVLGLTLGVFLFAERIMKLIGKTGGDVIVRVMGIILAAIAAESVISGVGSLITAHGATIVHQEMAKGNKTTMSAIYDFKVKTIDGMEQSLGDYKGKVLLIVNVASRCGFTPQYEGLEALHKKYKDRGLVVMGFPCNQFGGQEPGTDAEIKSFCSLTYNVSFPMFAKIDVNGDSAHPLYQFLKKEQKGLLGTEAIKWNFTKFLVDKSGKVIDRYASQTKPEELEKEIEKLL